MTRGRNPYDLAALVALREASAEVQEEDWQRRWREFNATLDVATTVATILDFDAVADFAESNSMTVPDVVGLLETYRHKPNYLQIN